MSATKAKPTTYPCAICGKPGRAETMTYSKWTGNRYCHDYNACQTRAKRAKRKEGTRTRSGLANG